MPVTQKGVRKLDINILDIEMGKIRESHTKMIQWAIDECSNSGGGRVIIPRDKTYTIDGIFIKSNVELHLEENAVLLGSGCEDEYIMRPGPFERLRNNTPISALIYSKHTENIKITGKGTIDGNYKKFIPEGQEDAKHIAFFKYPRPMTVYFEGCERIGLSDITITNAPFWTVHLVGCNQADICGVKIFNELRMPNTDGFDIDRCKNVRISNCFISTGDDAICPKCTEETAEYGDCENLTVENCVLNSASSAIKFGSSSFGNFRNCSFTNIDIRDTNRGLAFQIRDTHNVENVLFQNITIQTRRYSKEWWGTGEPVYVTICSREEGMVIGTIKNIIFENINCECENGMFFYSDKPCAIEAVTLKNIKMDFKRFSEYELSEYDLRPCSGEQMYHEQLSPILAVNVNHLLIDNVKITDPDNILLEKNYIFKNCVEVEEV